MKDKIFETCKLNPDHPTPRVYRVTLCDMGHKGGQIFCCMTDLAAHTRKGAGRVVREGRKSPSLTLAVLATPRSHVPTGNGTAVFAAKQHACEINRDLLQGIGESTCIFLLKKQYIKTYDFIPQNTHYSRRKT